MLEMNYTTLDGMPALAAMTTHLGHVADSSCHVSEVAESMSLIQQVTKELQVSLRSVYTVFRGVHSGKKFKDPCQSNLARRVCIGLYLKAL